MTLQNRVSPYAEIVATPERGTLLGNRGRLHNVHRELIRTGRTKNWITCRLEFKGRHREVMGPRSYTALFFLDEATSLAAGHRPCAECRRGDYLRFKRYWAAAGDLAEIPFAMEMDLPLDRERRARSEDGTYLAVRLDALPDGTFVDLDGAPWLLQRGRLARWTFGGYREIVDAPDTSARVITPPSIVRTLSAGYRAEVHRSAGIS